MNNEQQDKCPLCNGDAVLLGSGIDFFCPDCVCYFSLPPIVGGKTPHARFRQRPESVEAKILIIFKKYIKERTEHLSSNMKNDFESGSFNELCTAFNKLEQLEKDLKGEN